MKRLAYLILNLFFLLYPKLFTKPKVTVSAMIVWLLPNHRYTICQLIMCFLGPLPETLNTMLTHFLRNPRLVKITLFTSPYSSQRQTEYLIGTVPYKLPL